MSAKVSRLSDVARTAEVSVATVSRFLNNRLQLPEETAARIRRAVAEHEYTPNPHARNLSLGRSETIALVVPDIANPYFARLAAAVEREAGQQGYALTLCASLNTLQREREYIARLSGSAVDGIIFVSNHADDGTLRDPINASSRRVVILDEDVGGVVGPRVFSDNELGGYLAGRHLIEMGHRSIAFFGGPQAMRSTEARLAGIRRAIAESNQHVVIRDEFFGAYSPEHGRACASRFLSSGSEATALLVSSDEIMIGALEIFRREGIRLPSQLSVIGFDDIAPFVLFDPPLTSIRQPVEMMGRRAVDLLIRSLRGEDLDRVIEYLPVELILRGSVSHPRAGKRLPPSADNQKEGNEHDEIDA
ncbi:transcriptional regulator, LacI family [Kaistia soli DSM 19436]|uniref:Transcriptional regulator, LacI family n=1 Tax=Kaistia soli DSM 19436 TaxID=1122133 RepID=A0A1M5I5G1_9HYPH|nr:LacI family DNA-binding transcriptional regulator [Kaistia soli]SHG23319.1 transcriptional regulator, LacI family [Kaistia soli DSM 19436]